MGESYLPKEATIEEYLLKDRKTNLDKDISTIDSEQKFIGVFLSYSYELCLARKTLEGHKDLSDDSLVNDMQELSRDLLDRMSKGLDDDKDIGDINEIKELFENNLEQYINIINNDISKVRDKAIAKGAASRSDINDALDKNFEKNKIYKLGNDLKKDSIEERSGNWKRLGNFFEGKIDSIANWCFKKHRESQVKKAKKILGGVEIGKYIKETNRNESIEVERSENNQELDLMEQLEDELPERPVMYPRQPARNDIEPPKPEPKKESEQKPEVKKELKAEPEQKSEVQPEKKEVKPEVKKEPKIEVKPERKPEVQPEKKEVKPEVKKEPKIEAKPEQKPEVQPEKKEVKQESEQKKTRKNIFDRARNLINENTQKAFGQTKNIDTPEQIMNKLFKETNQKLFKMKNSPNNSNSVEQQLKTIENELKNFIKEQEKSSPPEMKEVIALLSKDENMSKFVAHANIKYEEAISLDLEKNKDNYSFLRKESDKKKTAASYVQNNTELTDLAYGFVHPKQEKEPWKKASKFFEDAKCGEVVDKITKIKEIANRKDSIALEEEVKNQPKDYSYLLKDPEPEAPKIPKEEKKEEAKEEQKQEVKEEQRQEPASKVVNNLPNFELDKFVTKPIVPKKKEKIKKEPDEIKINTGGNSFLKQMAEELESIKSLEKSAKEGPSSNDQTDNQLNRFMADFLKETHEQLIAVKTSSKPDLTRDSAIPIAANLREMIHEEVNKKETSYEMKELLNTIDKDMGAFIKAVDKQYNKEINGVAAQKREELSKIKSVEAKKSIAAGMLVENSGILNLSKEFKKDKMDNKPWEKLSEIANNSGAKKLQVQFKQAGEMILEHELKRAKKNVAGKISERENRSGTTPKNKEIESKFRGK